MEEDPPVGSAPVAAVQRQTGDGPVGDADALGQARRAGGVHHVRELVDAFVGGGGRGVAGGRVDGRGGVRVVEDEVRAGSAGQARDDLGVRQEQRRSGVGQHEADALGRVLGVHRQVGAAGLEDGQQGDDQFGRARQGHAHDGLLADAAGGQYAGQPVRPGVQLAVGEGAAAGGDGDVVRGGGGPFLEQGGDGPAGDGDGGVVELVQDGGALGGLQDVHRADAGVRVRHELLEDPREAGGDALDGLRVEEVVLVLEGDAQVRVGEGHHDQRVVGAAERADAGDRDARGGVGLLDGDAVDRVRLEADEGVEEDVQPDRAVDVQQSVVVVVEQGALPVLQVAQQAAEGGAGGALHPDGQGVDEQADHRVDTGDDGRAAGDGGAEDDVLAAGQSGEDERPGALDEGVEGEAQFGGAPAEVAGGVRGQRDVDLADAGRVGRGARVRGDQRRRLDSGEFGGPGAGGGLAVLAGLPHQEVAVAGDPRQRGGVALGAVQPQQVLHEDRDGPPVEEDVVGGEDELPAVGRHHHEGHPHERGPGQVEVRGVVLRQEALQRLLAALLAEPAEVQVLPGQLHAVAYDLHPVPRRVEDEGGAEVGVPVEERLAGGPHAGRLDLTGEVEDELHLVGVEGGAGELGVEEQAVLHGGQRPDVLQAGVALLPGLDLVLAHRDQRYVRGGQAARAGRGGVPGQGLQGGAPQLGQLLDVLLREQTRGEGEAGAELRPLLGVGDERADVQGGQGRHPVARPGDQLGGALGEGPAQAAQVLGHVRGGEAAEVVEADLAAGVAAQDLGGLRVQVPQQAVSEALVREGQQLLLDGLDRGAGGGAARERVVEVDPGDVEADGEHGGEPAHGARQVGAGDGVLLTAVSLDPDQG